MMIKQYAAWMLLPLSITVTPVQAEVLRIPLGQQNAKLQQIDKPTLGMTKASVLAQYGEPQQRYAAVGEPPISRWQYSEFTVYFESNVVMHSVVQHRRQDEESTSRVEAADSQ